jgi:hypothetical protein
MYYESMVASNRSYESKFTERDLGLSPTEEFNSTANKTTQEAISAAEDSEHELQRQRLLEEEKAREHLLETLKQAKEAQKTCVVRIPPFASHRMPVGLEYGPSDIQGRMDLGNKPFTTFGVPLLDCLFMGIAIGTTFELWRLEYPQPLRIGSLACGNSVFVFAG